jgi:uncharacterized protein (TIGR03067 family)
VNVGPGLVLALALAPPASKEAGKPAPVADHALVGEWVVDSHVASGKALPRVGKVERVTITRDRWKVKKESEFESYVSLDGAKDPPQIDVWLPDQEGKSGAGASTNSTATCSSSVCTLGPDRPTKFDSLPKSGVYLLTLKRVAVPKCSHARRLA